MVSMIGRPQTGEVVSITAMGGEGAQWVGLAPFVGDRHMFQNMGDGTFFHSGQLAIQSAVSAGANITFKILYNAAVAMTGGQDAAGVRPVPDVAAMLLAEGVKRVVITTDDPDKYRGVSVPAGVDVMHRDRIVEAQEQLRAIDGVTVLIHDQQCAAEKRRERKRGRVKQASFRVMIDERVCEGCGDCGVKSNCLSLHSIDTEFGRKTVVDQASCNIDASCLKGDCPAFVTVAADSITGRSTGAANRPLDPASLPDPARLPASATIRMPGIGGTGVVTVSQVLATAAKLVGKPASSVDQTGLSQKAGPVVSTLSIGDVTPGRVDVLLAFDPLSSATPRNLGGLDPATSVAIVSTSVAPTGRMIGKVASMGIDLAPVRAEIDARTIEREQPLPRRRRPHDRAVRQLGDRERVRRRRRLSGRTDPVAGRRDRAGDRAQRRRRRGQPDGVPLGSVVVRRPGDGRAAGRSHDSGGADEAVRRRDVRRSRAPAAGRDQSDRPRRVPERQVRPALRRDRARGRRGRDRLPLVTVRSAAPSPASSTG